MLSNGLIVLHMFIAIKKEYWNCIGRNTIKEYKLCNLVLPHFKIELAVFTYSRTVSGNIVVVGVFCYVVQLF